MAVTRLETCFKLASCNRMQNMENVQNMPKYATYVSGEQAAFFFFLLIAQNFFSFHKSLIFSTKLKTSKNYIFV